MKLKMSKNSLFALLLRSPWWISLLVAAAIALASRALLPEPYFIFGATGGFPFLVIGCMAAWRQRHAPSAARLADVLARIASMSWREFSSEIEQGFGRQGYAVTRLHNASVDFSLVKGGHMTLLTCRRWKAASLGVDALRELVASKEAQGAQECIVISLGDVTASAARFAHEQGIRLMLAPELAQLIGK